MAVLCLLLASVCQWFAGRASSELGTLGMAVPVPVSWEAAKAGGPSAPPSFAGEGPGRPEPSLNLTVTPASLFQSGFGMMAADRQERLLRWGQLLL